MSEIKDTLAFTDAVLEKFAEVDARDAAHDKRLVELEKFAAILDRGQQTMNHQIDIFRDAMNEGFDRIRREMSLGKRR